MLLSGCSPVAAWPALIMQGAAQDYAVFIEGQPSAAAQNVSAQDAARAQNSCFDGGCHAALKEQQDAYVHTAFKQEECLACHTADHSDPELTPERSLAMCYACHAEESLGNSHRVGEGVIDPRNGEQVTCLSCHAHHGSENPSFLQLDGRGTLCVSCHTEFVSP
jgi:predicted CXXCH cytochrome family protein